MCHLKALEKKGLIAREAHMARAIQLANQPISRSALPDIGRLDGTNPIEALGRGNEAEFAPLFENSDNFAVTAAGDTLIDAHVADGDTVVFAIPSASGWANGACGRCNYQWWGARSASD